MPYTTGAAPVRYFNLHASLASDTAATTDVSLADEDFPDECFLTSRAVRWSLSKTDCANLSISRSVTSHRLATSVGLCYDDLSSDISEHRMREMRLTIQPECSDMGCLCGRTHPVP